MLTHQIHVRDNHLDGLALQRGFRVHAAGHAQASFHMEKPLPDRRLALLQGIQALVEALWNTVAETGSVPIQALLGHRQDLTFSSGAPIVPSFVTRKGDFQLRGNITNDLRLKLTWLGDPLDLIHDDDVRGFDGSWDPTKRKSSQI